MVGEINTKTTPKLSCAFCKKRKIKCDYKIPCSNCTKFKKVCEPTLKDMRRKKFSKNYIMTLKNQVSSLESFIKLLKNSPASERNSLLENFDILNLHLEESEEGNEDIRLKPNVETEQTKIVLENENDTQFAVYGKPSVFIPSQKRIITTTTSYYGFEEFQSPIILKYVSNFFIWKYMENNLYIYRESFLTDFFRDKEDLKESLNYCNEELILAICAHGSSIELGQDMFVYQGVTYDSPEKFYNKAKDLTLKKLSRDDCNTITSIQTLLTLAFFDLGRGKIFSAWTLSGLAFRIGVHMGFEIDLNPLKKNDITTEIPITDYDINVKSRIYWGCRVADYYISFLLGRAPTLDNLYATIPESKNLPLLQGVDFFLYPDPVTNETKIFNISNPLEQLNNLYEIVNKYHKLVYRDQQEEEKDGLHFQKWLHLDRFNLTCFEWKDNLNHELYWTKTELKITGYNPNRMFFRYQYYLVILLFNRDFVGLEYNGSIGEISPEVICARAIEDVYSAMKCFSKYHKFQFASLNMVYLSILSIVILDKISESTQTVFSKEKMIGFFSDILRECVRCYELASSAYMSFSYIFEKYKMNEHLNSVTDMANDTAKTSATSKRAKGKTNGELANDSDDCIIPSLNYTTSELFSS